jgi:transposase-like protein
MPKDDPDGLCRPRPDLADTSSMMRSPRNPVHCPDCGSANLISVAMSIGEGEVLFRTCPPCEARWWEQDGSRVSRETALQGVPRR